MNKEQLEEFIAAENVDLSLLPNLFCLLADEELRYPACRALGKVITQKSEVVEIIRERLAHSDVSIQYFLISSLRYAEANVQSLIPDLIEFLSSNNDSLREIAANTLGEIHAKAAVPKLMELMCGDKNYNVRYYAMHALCDIKDTETIAPLITFIQRESVETKMYAIHILGKMGRDAKSAISYIFPYLEAEDEKLSAIAATALGNMGDQRARSFLEKMIKSTSPSFTISARRALQNLETSS